MRRWQVALAGLAMSVSSSAQAAEPGKIGLELNKLEDSEGSCRITMVVANGTERAMTALQADLVTFAGDGAIDGRITVELGPLDPAKTVVKAFDLPQRGCATIGRMLLNEMVRCEDDRGPVEGCTRLVTPSSRIKTELFK